jgi:ankyrin repeat protein
MFGIEPIPGEAVYSDALPAVQDISLIRRLECDMPQSELGEDPVAMEIANSLDSRVHPSAVVPMILKEYPILYSVMFFYGSILWLRSLSNPEYKALFRFPGAKDYGGRSIAHFAAAGGKLRLLAELRDEDGNNERFAKELAPLLDTPDNQGFTPLQYAVAYGNVDDMKFLLRDREIPIDPTILDRTYHHSLLDIALVHGHVAAAFYLLDGSIDWRNLSPFAFHMIARQTWSDGIDDLLPLVDRLLEREFDPSMISQEDSEDNVLSIAAKYQSGALFVLLEKIPWLMSSETLNNPFLTAAESGNLSQLEQLCTRVGLIDFTNRDGETALMRAVRCRQSETAAWLIGHGANRQLCDDNNLSIADVLGPQINPLGSLSFIEDDGKGITLAIPIKVAQREEKSFPFDRPHNFCSRRTGSTDLSLQEIVGFLHACPHFVVLHAPRHSEAKCADWQVSFHCTDCIGIGNCLIHMKWPRTGASFSLTTSRCCIHCFEGFLQKESPRSKVYLAKCRQARGSWQINSKHPLRKLAARLADDPVVSEPDRQYIRSFAQSRTAAYMRRVIQEHVDEFEHLIDHIPGWIEIQCVNQFSDSPVLTYYGEKVIDGSWIAPWTPDLLQANYPFWDIQCYEFDASFDAIAPFCYCVPTAVSHNVGIPLGLIFAPTERAQLYHLFLHALQEIDSDLVDLVTNKPLLSDQGQALESFAREAGMEHFYCFRHLLENLGSKTFAAILARRLLFTASEAEYNRLKFETFEEFDCAVQLHEVTESGKRVFCNIFGLQYDDERKLVEIDPTGFARQALWGSRLPHGVAACTNHVEGEHAHLNAAVKPYRSLTRRLSIVINALITKVKELHKNPFRSAKTKLKQMTKSKAPQTGVCHCGWSDIYCARFGIPDYPCPHTVNQYDIDFPDAPPICVNEASAGRINRIDYRGEAWDFASSRTVKKKSPDSEEENIVIGDGFEAFIRQVRFEMQVIWPEAPFTDYHLAADLGAMIQKRSGKAPKGDGSELRDASLRTQFMLKWFEKARNRKSS